MPIFCLAARQIDADVFDMRMALRGREIRARLSRSEVLNPEAIRMRIFNGKA